MSSSQQTQTHFRRGDLAWRIGLWAAQILLCGAFGAAKTFLSPEALVGLGIGYATEIPYWLLRFIGICELAGATGIVLPALTRIKPGLVALAALGFAVIQILAIAFHTFRGDIAMTAPVNLLLLGLSVFVLWGRSKKAAIHPRE